MLKTTREQLEKLKALEAAATPGPWSVETVGTQVGLCHKVGGGWPHRKSFTGTQEQYACVYEDGGDPRNPGKELHANAQVFAESRNALAALLHDAAVAHRLYTPRRLDEWHEDFGPALWFHIPIQEPPYCGTPDCSDWPYPEEDEAALIWTPLPDANWINDAAESLLSAAKAAE